MTHSNKDFDILDVILYCAKNWKTIFFGSAVALGIGTLFLFNQNASEGKYLFSMDLKSKDSETVFGPDLLVELFNAPRVKYETALPQFVDGEAKTALNILRNNGKGGIFVEFFCDIDDLTACKDSVERKLNGVIRARNVELASSILNRIKIADKYRIQINTIIFQLEKMRADINAGKSDLQATSAQILSNDTTRVFDPVLFMAAEIPDSPQKTDLIDRYMQLKFALTRTMDEIIIFKRDPWFYITTEVPNLSPVAGTFQRAPAAKNLRPALQFLIFLGLLGGTSAILGLYFFNFLKANRQRIVSYLKQPRDSYDRGQP